MSETEQMHDYYRDPSTNPYRAPTGPRVIPKQGLHEDDHEYVDRMNRERPDLSLDDLGFVEVSDGEAPSDD